jgi:hypothetical protein
MSLAGSESVTSTTVSKPIENTARVGVANTITILWGMGLHQPDKTGNVAAERRHRTGTTPIHITGAQRLSTNKGKGHEISSGMPARAKVTEHSPPVHGVEGGRIVDRVVESYVDLKAQ